MRTIYDLRDRVRSHPCYTHPIFEHWARVQPRPEVVGALFHQIQKFCSSTRPGGAFPDALREMGMDGESHLIAEIVESEEDHGPELATMAGYILNRASGESTCADLTDQAAVEATLKKCSDDLLGTLPGYQHETGLLPQTRNAIAVFERRNDASRQATLRNLGTALGLEIISNRHLIPGEMHCLVESGLYKATLDDDEMHYLLEHFGETGAEHQHEKKATEAVGLMLNEETEPFILAGMDDFLDSINAFWDVLDTALLQSGRPAESPVSVGA